MRIKIPKTIWAILATISISVVGFFVLPSFWFWVCWEILSLGLVAIGCAGEWYLFLKPAKESHESHHRRRELQFITAVAVGVWMEFLALAHAIPETMRLEKDVALANERASTNELAAKQLEMQFTETKTKLANAEARLNESVMELKNENLPMDIGEQSSFINALKPLAGIQVELRSMADAKTKRTEEMLFSTLIMAGWQVINRSFIGDIGEDGVVIGYNGDAPSERAAHFLLKLLTERNVPSKIIEDPRGHRVRGVPTNAIIIAVCQRPGRLQANLMAVQAKRNGLRAELSEIRAGINELLLKKYVPASKELAEAQAKFNSLNAQSLQSDNEEKALFEQELKLSSQYGFG